MPPRKKIRMLSICLMLMFVTVVLLGKSSADDRQNEIATRARDVLSRRCFACHRANGAIKREAWDREFDEVVLELGLGRLVTRAGAVVRNSSPGAQRLPRFGMAGFTAESILSRARTISISSMTMFLKPGQLENELFKRPEFEAMGLLIVTDATKADLMIDLDRPVFTYTFTYSVSSADTRSVVMSGKVIAFDGNFAAPMIAKNLIQQIRAARGGSGK